MKIRIHDVPDDFSIFTKFGTYPDPVAKQKSNTPATPIQLFGLPEKYWGFFAGILGLLLYVQTVSFEYTQDDAIVITDNMFTTKGVSGISGIFGNDTFYGYFKDKSKLKLVSGGRYRPLTPAMFAFEYGIVGANPWFSHLMNAVWYGILCFVLYLFLKTLFTPRLTKEGAAKAAFIAALIFAAHPLHTEAVANIKGRDEIIAALGAVAGLYFTLSGISKGNSFKYFVLAAGSFLLGMLAKENVITMLAVVPFTIWWYQKSPSMNGWRNILAIGVASILFLLIRTAIVGWSTGETPLELMNNPFLKLVNNRYVPFSFAEKSATIVYTMGKYLQLLLFPYPLTHDYYPRQIPIMNWSDPGVIISFLAWVGLLIVVIKGWRARTWWAYGIIFYVCTMSVTSNILFPIGTNMSERFAFLPSIGFALIAGVAVYKLWSSSRSSFAIPLVLILLLASSTWTLVRSQVWKSNTSLFTSDAKNSPNSAKLLNALGGDLVTRSEKEKDATVKQKMLKDAQVYLNHALEIHPNYKLSYLLLGNCYYHSGDYQKAVEYFRHVLTIDPQYGEGRRNLGIALRELGKQQGEKNNNLAGAITLLDEAVTYLPEDFETYHLLGVAYGQSGQGEKAISYFRKEIELAPNNATAYFNLGIALRQMGDEAGAQASFDKARSLDPNLPQLKGK